MLFSFLNQSQTFLPPDFIMQKHNGAYVEREGERKWGFRLKLMTLNNFSHVWHQTEASPFCVRALIFLWHKPVILIEP